MHWMNIYYLFTLKCKWIASNRQTHTYSLVISFSWNARISAKLCVCWWMCGCASVYVMGAVQWFAMPCRAMPIKCTLFQNISSENPRPINTPFGNTHAERKSRQMCKLCMHGNVQQIMIQAKNVMNIWSNMVCCLMHLATRKIN